jgi:hypothetical protein
MEPKELTVKLTKGGGQQPAQIVRPSSLNYKISLREAVLEFIKKDMPCGDDQVIRVETEETKQSTSTSKASQVNHNHAYEDFCDMMFDMTINQKPPATNKKPPFSAQDNQQKDVWFKEEESMRKKLEKGAINQLKSRIAQQNRVAGSKMQNQPDLANDNNDSDNDALDKNDIGDVPTTGGAVNPNQVQLNPQQVEEAKQMTYGKLKQFRRDRLYTSDKDRVGGLMELLKKARINDDQQNCQTC